MRFSICDDNVEFTEILVKYLDKYQIEEKMDFHVDVFHSVEDLTDSVKENNYNLIFLDIEFPEKSGIDFANFLRFNESNYNTEIIFISGSESYYKDLFSFQPFGFLGKPIVYEELSKLLYLFFNNSRVSKNIFTYKKNTIKYIVPYEKIRYFMSSNRKVEIHMLNDYDSFYSKLDDLENLLDKNTFIRVHKSYIVNINYIKKVSIGFLELENEESISISSGYRDNFIVLFEEKFGE